MDLLSMGICYCTLFQVQDVVGGKCMTLTWENNDSWDYDVANTSCCYVMGMEKTSILFVVGAPTQIDMIFLPSNVDLGLSWL